MGLDQIACFSILIFPFNAAGSMFLTFYFIVTLFALNTKKQK